jgi:hypothetical protein
VAVYHRKHGVQQEDQARGRREGERPPCSALQPADTPAEDPVPDMPLYTPFDSPGMHRLAKKPAPARRPLQEMSDFEKETEIKNAHFVRRLANAQQQLGKSHSSFPDCLSLHSVMLMTMDDT